MDIWPNFFIVGAPRAGTTTLYDILNRTPEVYMSQIKEPHYFSKINKSKLYPPPIRNKEKYLALFRNVKDEKAIGEASTSYIGDPYSPKLIHDIIPDARIIMILRDPINLAYSWYLFRVGYGKTYSFAEAIQESLENPEDYTKRVTISSGYYSSQVKRYLDTFDEEKLKVLIFEEFIEDLQRTVKQVFTFLGVKEDPPEYRKLIHNIITEPRGKISISLLQNQTIKKFVRKVIPEDISEFTVRKILGKKISKPKMSEKDRLFLKNHYKDDVKELEGILKHKVPWPNFK